MVGRTLFSPSWAAAAKSPSRSALEICRSGGDVVAADGCVSLSLMMPEVFSFSQESFDGGDCCCDQVQYK